MGVIVGFVSQKGGVGKSTLARAIAREAAVGKLQVKIADLDVQQGSSVNWHRRRLAGSIEPIFSVESYRAAAQALEQANGLDALIIDGPARASAGTLEIARVADLVVQPTGASLDDLEPAIQTFHDLVRAGIDRNKLTFALCRVGTEAEERGCRIYIGKAGYEVLKGCIYERAAYRQAMNAGNTITETRYSKLNKRADQLIQALVDKITDG